LFQDNLGNLGSQQCVKFSELNCYFVLRLEDKKIHSIQKIMVSFLKNESLTTRLTLIIVGLTAGSGLLIPATYASFHPVTSSEIADNSILSVDIGNGQVRTEDIGAGQVRTGDIANDAIIPNIQHIYGNAVAIPPGGFASATADCPDGTVLSGGGYNSGYQTEVYENLPTDSNKWKVVAYSYDTFNQIWLQPWAICIGPMP
jgi:hypothetical protein